MNSSTRRRFIELLPLAGVGLLTACSDKSSTNPAASPTAAPPASPPPAPAAVDPAPAAAVTATPAPAPVVAAAAMPVVDEKDPTAVSLGYVSDVSRADAAKYKTYTPGAACGNCALFGGKAGEATGPCPLFGGRQVSVKGWCSAHAKKTG